MKRQGWSDKQVEDIIRNLPKVIDHRDPREIYQNISLQRRKKRAYTLIPSVALAAAAMLLFLLLSPELSDKKSGSNTQAPLKVEDGLEKENPDENSQATLQVADEENNQDNSPSALYQEDLGSKKAITIYVPEKQIRFLVPITMAIEEEEGKTWLDSLKVVMGSLKESEWGLSEYYPMQADFKLVGSNSLNVDVPSSNQFGDGSGSETMLLEALNENIAANSGGEIKQINLSTDNKPGIELGNFGTMTDIPVALKKNRIYYFTYIQGNDNPYLVPSKEEYKDFGSALKAMAASSPDGILEPALPEVFKFKDVEPKDEALYLTFENDIPLKDDHATLLSIEAILLTAREFGFSKVKFENASIGQIGKFNLSEELVVPIGPNKVDIN